jgi:hypothetical protein
MWAITLFIAVCPVPVPCNPTNWYNSNKWYASSSRDQNNDNFIIPPNYVMKNFIDIRVFVDVIPYN